MTVLYLPRSCTLCNGTLQLHKGLQLQVNDGPACMERLIISGGIHDGLLSVNGGALDIRSCHLTNSPGWGIIVNAGSASCTDCSVSDCLESAFTATSEGAEITIQGTCTAHSCSIGYLAQSGGELFVGASALSECNREFGFASIGKDSRLLAGSGCIARRNGTAGYIASDNANLEVGSGCESVGNGESGFRACSGGTLVAEGAVVADGNTFNGFDAHGDGTRLSAGPCCISRRNVQDGFLSSEGALLEVAAGCESVSNLWSGFRVTSGGRLTAEAEVIAEGNISNGFDAHGECSRLCVGSNCVARRNVQDGFLSWEGASLEAGPGCESFSNMYSGFRALLGGKLVLEAAAVARDNTFNGFDSHGKGSRLLAGPSCVARQNATHGFTSCNGANLEAGPGCESVENGASGFQATTGSKMACGKRCLASGNKSGFYVSSSDASVGEESWAEDNKECGFRALNSNLRVGARCKGEGETSRGERGGGGVGGVSQLPSGLPMRSRIGSSH